ncbi:MAG: M48 family metallopeptidase [Lachnospiraceae bacterium]|nr:M48 family metallopeptidase [Lachnospiraceae bacterium]
MKIFVIISYLLCTAFAMFKRRLADSYVDRELPENIRDVYNEDEYNRWKAYRKEGQNLSRIEKVVTSILLLCFLLFNLHSKVFYAINANDYVRYLFALTVINLISDIISLPFDYYDTFVIEEKYGLNTSTKKTFFLDAIKEFIIGMVLSYGLLVLIMLLYNRFGNVGIIWICLAIVAISLLISIFAMTFLSIFNKFSPLEDGELKTKLLDLCGKYGIKVKKIVVKDASRRTTTANAFCTGLGNTKTISLDDNLIKDYTTDQIVAVFTHEFAHAKFKHIFKSLPFGILRTVLIIAALGIIFNIPALYTAFGFTTLNYMMAIQCLGYFTWPFSTLLDLISNKISRNHEYQADAFAAEEGYGEDLISSLKKLCKESLSNINPHPWIVKLDYSHPTLSQRIEAIRNIESERF